MTAETRRKARDDRRHRNQLRRQATSRQLIRDAVRIYAKLRTPTGTYTDQANVILADGTPVVALITVHFVPPIEEPTP